jgi:hypothetical protein
MRFSLFLTIAFVSAVLASPQGLGMFSIILYSFCILSLTCVFQVASLEVVKAARWAES